MSRPVPPPSQTPPAAQAARSWYLDALASLAFFWLAFGVGKKVAGILGIFGGVFFLLFTLGMGYWFARSAWRGVIYARNKR